MKKLFLFCMPVLLFCASFTFAGEFGFGINTDPDEDATIVATQQIAVGGVTEDQEEGLVDTVIKSIINWFLGILGLVALVVMLYGGFLMVTSAGGESYAQGWKILKFAAIGLLIIGLAWFVLSLVFWLIVQAGENVGAGNTNT